MWSPSPPHKLKGTMGSPLDLTNGRPWTPPDTDSDHFSEQRHVAEESDPEDCDNQYTFSPHPPTVRAKMDEGLPRSHSMPSSLVDSGYVESAQDVVPQYADLEDPYTPLKATTPDPHAQNGIPQYPYTPDSARVPSRKYTLPPLSPLPRMPWDASSSSPVQNALSSCVTHLENLIQTRQPNDDQMEYIITRFEEMAQFLSAPEAQSRQSDDHLFSELELPSGLGISGEELTNVDQKIRDVDMAVEYILKVGKYIEDVSRHTEDLKMRFDEAKQLNSIQTEIITDLRRILSNQQYEMKQYKEELEADVASEKHEEEKAAPKADVKRPYQTTSFWTAIGEALDEVGELWLEW
ncbi:hypothetical protein CC80DRAFT_498241 [Byssothecium circinans]|uniref:Uncharacterized protein n=1 Tax=Byssothecium circinans TaxID=147558 RepID=A0A6A5T647_9PLEO|nr:hypothetical protein CC80DRAFT_498241 [Byssothecium circinans]